MVQTNETHISWWSMYIFFVLSAPFCWTIMTQNFIAIIVETNIIFNSMYTIQNNDKLFYLRTIYINIHIFWCSAFDLIDLWPAHFRELVHPPVGLRYALRTVAKILPCLFVLQLLFENLTNHGESIQTFWNIFKDIDASKSFV